MTAGTLHRVQRGDTIVLIARRYGFRAIEPIWEHPNNAELRKTRPNPYLLAEGDSVFVPDKELAEYACDTDKRHVFRVRTMTQSLDQVLLDHDHKPLAGKRYDLKAGGKTFQGTTPSDGRLHVEIPLDVKTAELKVWVDEPSEACVTWTLQLGHLEPVETPYGLKGHLTNLGYDCGTLDSTPSPQLEQALRAFQRDHELAETGKSDEATLAKLRALFAYPLESV